MINVFFSETGAGIMRLNQLKGRIDPEDKILCLNFMLEQGRIDEPADSQYRSDYILDLFTQNGYVTDIKDIEEMKSSIAKYSRDLNLLKEYAARQEPIRVWNEMSPASIAGFYHLCAELDPYDVGFKYIEIPRRFHNPNYTIRKSSLQTSLYDRLEELMSLEMDVPYFDVNYYASLWNDLVDENATLRAMVNGQLISVPDNMFDFIILKHLDVPKQELAVIGEIMTTDQKRLSDYWIAKRIGQLIDEGMIEILENSQYPYERVLIRTDESV